MLDANVETFAERVGVTRACAAFGVNPRTHRHRRQAAEGRQRPRPPRQPRPRRAHPAALSDEEKDGIIAELCSERFWDLAPAQVYTTLLDEGVYLCSERQMYRVLTERGLVRRQELFRRTSCRSPGPGPTRPLPLEPTDRATTAGLEADRR